MTKYCWVELGSGWLSTDLPCRTLKLGPNSGQPLGLPERWFSCFFENGKGKHRKPCFSMVRESGATVAFVHFRMVRQNSGCPASPLFHLLPTGCGGFGTVTLQRPWAMPMEQAVCGLHTNRRHPIQGHIYCTHLHNSVHTYYHIMSHSHNS